MSWLGEPGAKRKQQEQEARRRAQLFWDAHQADVERLVLDLCERCKELNIQFGKPKTFDFSSHGMVGLKVEDSSRVFYISITVPPAQANTHFNFAARLSQDDTSFSARNVEELKVQIKKWWEYI